jgi:hypothetical protein
MKNVLVALSLLCMFCLGWIGTAHAALFNVLDYERPGDGLITEDTISGLRWLDVTSTEGVSYNYVINNTNYLNEGYRYATATEVSELWLLMQP